MSMMPSFSIPISPELYSQITELVKLSGKSEVEIMREAIEEYRRNRDSRDSAETKSDVGPQPQQTAYEVALKGGLIGCVAGPHADLATNPHHMEGFGRE